MKKTVKKYHLKDPQQYEDEREYWRNKTPEERLMALEELRRQYCKLKGIDADQGVQRVYKIVKRSES
jgi:ribosomal protein L29